MPGIVMLVISTHRLRLLALTAAQLRLFLADQEQLATELDLKPFMLTTGQLLQRAIGLKLTAMAQVEDGLWPWHTYWLIVDRAKDKSAGLIGFKGGPDDAGQVEIGYGIEEVQRGQGFATEAVRGLVAWAFGWPRCQSVTARTQVTNEASAAVLRKAGFKPYGAEDEQVLWRLTKTTR
jgi:RimJ/RimL family protein N-acetyltransferase